MEGITRLRSLEDALKVRPLKLTFRRRDHELKASPSHGKSWGFFRAPKIGRISSVTSRRIEKKKNMWCYFRIGVVQILCFCWRLLYMSLGWWLCKCFIQPGVKECFGVFANVIWGRKTEKMMVSIVGRLIFRPYSATWSRMYIPIKTL